MAVIVCGLELQHETLLDSTDGLNYHQTMALQQQMVNY